jgi:hypothetical protein
MMNEYNIKDPVWIHLGERSLVEGRVVEIINLKHLNENHKIEDLYVIEIKTGIEDVYEVRNFDMISPDPRGPIMAFRKLEDAVENNRMLKKLGMPIPMPGISLEEALALEDEEDDVSPDTIHAALDRRIKEAEIPALMPGASPKPKRKFYKRNPKNPT